MKLAIVSLLALIAPATQPVMNAIRVHEYGKADVLKLEQIPRPSPREDEMLVRVYAAGVNPIDWKIRSGTGRGKLEKPYTPGYDVSGVIEEVGAKVTKFKVGDAIIAKLDRPHVGAYAEYCIVRPDEAALKPAKISHSDAAGVPLVGLTAWQAIFDTAKLEKGQTILIHGGAGGVGSAAIQLAKWKGAKVIATASKENHDFLKQLGADETIDYRTQKFDEIVKDADVVLDTIGGDTQAASWKVLKKGGFLVSIVGGASQETAKEHGVRAAAILEHIDSAELEQISKLIDEGHIKPVTTQIFPLADAAKAHEQSETRHTRGKIVLLVKPE